MSELQITVNTFCHADVR